MTLTTYNLGSRECNVYQQKVDKDMLRSIKIIHLFFTQLTL